MSRSIPQVDRAIIGGTSTLAPRFLELQGVSVLGAVGPIETPFGQSAEITHLKFATASTDQCAGALFVPMHGWRENGYVRLAGAESAFWVLREAGVRAIVATGTVGSINHLLDPGDLVVPTDFIDLKKSHTTAFAQEKI